MKTETKYTFCDQDIIAMEDLQGEIARERRTYRREETWNYIEKLLQNKSATAYNVKDKRNKLNGYTYVYLGELRRIDYVKASFVETAYLNIDTHKIFTIDHCVAYTF